MKPKNQKYYLLPVQLTLLIRRERLIREFQTWLLLKNWCNGRMEITARTRSRLASFLHCSTRTIERYLKTLRERNWIGLDPKTNLTYIRGFDALLIIERIPGRLAVWFDIDRIFDTEAFLAASTDSILIRQQKVKEWRERAAGVHLKRGTNQPAPVPTFYPVALSLHNAFFGIAKSTAARERKLAAEAGFLRVRKTPPIPIPSNNRTALLEAFPELAGHIFQKDGQYYIRQTDGVQTNLLFKKRSRNNNPKS